MTVAENIEDILSRELNNSHVEMKLDTQTGKVAGRVIWAGFEGFTPERRQNHVFGHLRRGLTREEAHMVTQISTVTPGELEVAAAPL